MAKNDTLDNDTKPTSDDSLNPGTKNYRESLVGNGKGYLDSHGDNVQRNYNADDKSGEDSRQEIEDREKNGDSFYRRSKSSSDAENRNKRHQQRTLGILKGKLAKIGPAGGVVGLLIVLLGVTSSFLGPASLLTNLSSIVSNHMDFGNRLLTKTGKSYATAIFKGRDCGASKIKCKFTTVSDKRLKEWDKRGIKYEVDKSLFGRNKVRSLKFPNGKEVRTVRAYNALKYNDPYNHSKLQRFPIRATYLDTKSSINKSLKKFGVNLANKFKASNKKDKNERVAENNQKMDQKTDSTPDKEERIKKIKSTGKDRVSSATSSAKAKLSSFKESFKSSNPAIGAGMLACTTLTVIKATQAAIILMWHAELIKFMIPFIQAGSQAKEAGVNGEFDWETAEYYGDRLTRAVTQKEIDTDPDDTITQDMLGKTAMDSAGFAAALSGDFGNYNQNYVGWGPTSKIWGTETIKEIEGYLKSAGKVAGINDMQKGINYGCKALQYMAYSSLLACTGPQIVGCVASLAVRFAVGSLAGEKIVELITNELSDEAMDMIAKANLTSTLTGPALGDAIVSGAGVLASYSDRSSGFAVAGNSNQAFTAYRDMMNDVDFQETKIADNYESAANNQFNTQNKFSFVGRIASAVAHVPWDGTLLSSITNMARITGTITNGSTAFAMKQGIYQPMEIFSSEEKFKGALNGCQSTGLTELDIPCIGESGRTIPVIGQPVSNCLENEANSESGDACIEKAIDYLANKKYIDGDNGEPVDWSEYNSEKNFNNKFLMFMKYCGNDRQYPLGYTDIPIEDGTGDNADWYDGSACAYSGDKSKDDDLAWMSYYYTMCIAHYASDNDQDYCWDVAPAAAVTSAGNWIVPTPGPCLSSYGPRWGSLHAGIDLSPPSGTPIIAPTNMEITFAGMNSGGYGYMVTGRSTDGTGYSFRFGHMLNQPPVSVGQQVSKGQQIGQVGSTGDSTGPHLHFEIFPPGGDPASFSGAIDPLPVLAKNGVNISCLENRS